MTGSLAWWRWIAVALVAAAVGCPARSRESAARSGFDAEEGDRLERVVRAIGVELAGKDLKGIVVLRDGRRIGEAYFNGADARTLHDVRSVTKSITSALLGIAIDRGLVGGVDDPAGRYLPELDGGAGAHIRLRDLLTMRSGLAADDDDPRSPGNEEQMDAASDWLAFARGVPLAGSTGATYRYASLNAFLVGAVVERASSQRLDEFARAHLFEPLGIQAFSWRRDAEGHVSGHGNLRITARDAAAFGQLFLDRGVRGGRRILSEQWVDASFAPHVDIAQVDAYADSYGYMWYGAAVEAGGRTFAVHFASGNGGNKIYVVPELRLVVAITSSAYNTRRGHARSDDILRRVLDAVVADQGEPSPAR